MSKKLIVLTVLTVVACAGALLLAGPAPSADAQTGSVLAACPNPGYYTGTDATGDFQSALEDAISEAATCAGCCDQLISYELVGAEGQQGGIAGLDDIDVTIKASW